MEPNTPSAQPTPTPTPTPVKKSGGKLWIWLLVGGGVLVVIGVVILVLWLLVWRTGTASVTSTNNSAQPVPTNESNNATPNNASNNSSNNSAANSTTGDNLPTYMNGAATVLTDLGNAVDKWSAAADQGTNGDFKASTASLNDALNDVKAAEVELAKLTPSAQTAKLDDLLTQAVAKAREAMEQGILGNEDSGTADNIKASGVAIQALGTLMDEINTEVDKISKSSTNGAV